MRTRNCSLMSAMGALVLAVAMVPGALAQCGVNKNYSNLPPGTPSLVRRTSMHAALFNDDDDVTAFDRRHVACDLHRPYDERKSDPQQRLPMIDNAMVVLHSDKTEIMESARPPQDGNFCLGVWEKTGVRSYYVNHLPWLGNDTTNAPSGIGNPTAGAQITEHVTLSEDGNKLLRKLYAGGL